MFAIPEDGKYIIQEILLESEMKIIDRFFQPYEEYSERTTLSEEALKQALIKECPDSSKLSWKVIKASFLMSKTMVFVRCPDDPFRLYQVRGRRHSMQLIIQCEKISDSVTVLHITIAPDSRLRGVAYAFCIFALIWSVAASCIVWYLIFLPAVFLGFFFFVMMCCNAEAEGYVPEIRQGFREMLKKLECRKK